MGRIRIYTDRRAGMIYETRQRSGALFQDWANAGIAMPGYGTRSPGCRPDGFAKF